MRIHIEYSSQFSEKLPKIPPGFTRVENQGGVRLLRKLLSAKPRYLDRHRRKPVIRELTLYATQGKWSYLHQLMPANRRRQRQKP